MKDRYIVSRQVSIVMILAGVEGELSSQLAMSGDILIVTALENGGWKC